MQISEHFISELPWCVWFVFLDEASCSVHMQAFTYPHSRARTHARTLFYFGTIGFCGAFSVQQGALSAGAWVSQDKVRKANRASSGPHNMHGDTTVGFEVMPSNVK